MIDLSRIDHIFLYPGSTDLRKGRCALMHMSMEIAKDDSLHKFYHLIIFIDKFMI